MLWVVLAWVGSLAVAPIVWSLVGDLSEPTGMERMWSAPAWLIENQHLYASMGFVVLSSVLAVEIVGLRLRFFARNFLTVFVPLMCAAALAAFNLRVMTALTNGTNVSGGVAVLLGMPVAACMAVIHVYLLRDELRRERFLRLR